MMFKNTSAEGGLNGFLDAGSHMNGELSFEDTFHVHGKMTGKVVAKGTLIVGEDGHVDGEVQVRRVVVSGKVTGTLKASERVEINATGKVQADLQTPSLTIEEGAFFEGRCSMASPGTAVEKPEESRKVAQMPIAKRT
jgi:cytoskeletal protein CcmA (bactofilin family)